MCSGIRHAHPILFSLGALAKPVGDQGEGRGDAMQSKSAHAKGCCRLINRSIEGLRFILGRAYNESRRRDRSHKSRKLIGWAG
jgi:hypothetical protein